ncbi:hypothetical protein ES703_116531 [subsurface metagenome]
MDHHHVHYVFLSTFVRLSSAFRFPVSSLSTGKRPPVSSLSKVERPPVSSSSKVRLIPVPGMSKADHVPHFTILSHTLNIDLCTLPRISSLRPSILSPGRLFDRRKNDCPAAVGESCDKQLAASPGSLEKDESYTPIINPLTISVKPTTVHFPSSLPCTTQNPNEHTAARSSSSCYRGGSSSRSTPASAAETRSSRSPGQCLEPSTLHLLRAIRRSWNVHDRDQTVQRVFFVRVVRPPFDPTLLDQLSHRPPDHVPICPAKPGQALEREEPKRSPCGCTPPGPQQTVNLVRIPRQLFQGTVHPYFPRRRPPFPRFCLSTFRTTRLPTWFPFITWSLV